MLICSSCVASNTHGKNRAHVSLTGTAGLAVFDSPNIGLEKDSYNVSWSVNSHAAILEYRLWFRQQSRHRRIHHGQDIGQNTSNVLMHKNDWSNVMLPGAGILSPQYPAPPPFPGVTRQRMNYVVRGLQSGTTYEVRVQARNVHGWNKVSPIFHFTTKSNGKFFFKKLITYLVTNLRKL